jgi:hypothetical protein
VPAKWISGTQSNCGIHFYTGHPVVMKIHKVKNNRPLQLNSFYIMYGFNAAC